VEAYQGTRTLKKGDCMETNKDKPTIKELEELLDGPDRPIEILPNGEIRVKGDSVDFRSDLLTLLNQYSKENSSNTPDFILRNYLCDCLIAFENAVKSREKWYRR
jgi:hypothetical protein